jgi:mRNA-degrading endonuclease YafQ of YafQ-DinJ toxin-antitoxin module
MKKKRPRHRSTHTPVYFGPNVIYTEEFLHRWECLPLQKQEIVRKKVALLATNPAHPSLKTHRLKQANTETWECYLINSYPHRLLYQIQEQNIRLIALGGHNVVDRCHLRDFRWHKHLIPPPPDAAEPQ